MLTKASVLEHDHRSRLAACKPVGKTMVISYESESHTVLWLSSIDRNNCPPANGIISRRSCIRALVVTATRQLELLPTSSHSLTPAESSPSRTQYSNANIMRFVSDHTHGVLCS